jgi:hypothetical protein
MGMFGIFLFILYIHQICMHVLRFEILKTRKGVSKGKLVRTVVDIQMIPRSDLVTRLS